MREKRKRKGNVYGEERERQKKRETRHPSIQLEETRVTNAETT
jgi:hypothetical protein